MRTTAAEFRHLRDLFPDAVAARRNLLALGISPSTISKRCRPGGPWRRVLPGIVLLGTGEPTPRQQMRAGLVYAGVPAVLSGCTALHRHGLRRLPDDDAVRLLVPIDRQVSSHGFVKIRRTRRLPEPVWRSGLPLAPVPRALIDAAAALGELDPVRAMFADAVQRRICSPDDLAAELVQQHRPHTACARAVLTEITAGIRSAAEAWARLLLIRSGLPEPRWNVAVRRLDGSLIGVADAWWDVGLVWEIDSREWHLSPTEHDRDTRRQSGFAAEGIPVVHTRPSRLRAEGPSVLNELIRAHANATLSPRPTVIVEN